MRYLILIVPLFFLTSCSELWWARKCSLKYPVKDSTYERVVYKEGVPIQLPGEQFFINCDSFQIMKQALDEAAKNSQHGRYQPAPINTGRVPCPPCPPSTVRVDTYDRFKVQFLKSTAELKIKQSEVESANKALWVSKTETEQFRIATKFWRGKTILVSSLLAILLAINAFLIYLKIKNSTVRAFFNK